MSTIDFKASLAATKDSGTSVKTDTIPKLKGQDDYRVWSAHMKILLKTLGAWEIVELGAKPATTASDQKASYETLYNKSAALLVGVVSDELRAQIVVLEDPHLMWTHLREQYHRDNAYSFVSQLRAFTALSNSYNPSVSMSDFIATFEGEWLRLSQLASSTKDSYRTNFAKFLAEDKAKRDFLLGFLVDHHKNIVDNLTTKDDKSYTDVKRHLLDTVRSDNDSSETALAAFKPKGKGNGKKGNSSKKPSSSSSSDISCNWCRKHQPGKEKGHIWQNCDKLKQRNAQKKAEEAKKSKDEEAHAATEEEVRSSRFTFDTGASSHMTPYLDHFESIVVRSGFVKTAAEHGPKLAINGVGTVVLECLLGDGTVSSFRMHNVLLVPDISRPLFSWKAISRLNKGFGFNSTSSGIRLHNAAGKTLLEASLDDSGLYTIPVVTEQAHLTYDFWHEALGHLNPTALSKAVKGMYSDADTAKIPPAPKDFHCKSCIVSKSVHHPPKTVTPRNLKPFDLILSDLEGPFPDTSLGGARYFISLIDYATRYSWVRFLKKKSDAYQVIKDFILETKTQQGVTFKRFRADNGGEYIDHRVVDLFKDHGIINEPTPSHSPETLGIPERFNRTIVEATRAMLDSSGLSKQLWAEATATANYIKNRQPHAFLKDRTPYEALSGNKPSVLHLHPFGQKCFVHIPRTARPAGSKLSPRATEGFFVGYTATDRHYRVYTPVNKRVIITFDLHFLPLTGTEGVSKGTVTSLADLKPSTPPPTDNSTTSIDLPASTTGFPNDSHWLEWMERNPEEANRYWTHGHPRVRQLFQQEFDNGRRSGFLGPPFWDWDTLLPQNNNNQASPPPADADQPEADQLGSSSSSAASQQEQPPVRSPSPPPRRPTPSPSCPAIDTYPSSATSSGY